MNTDKRNFDKEAAAWDENPGRVKLANDVADVVAKEIVLASDMDVMDFGCGTGLVTLRLQPFVRSITGIDSSQGMLDVLRTKIVAQNLENVRTLYLDPDRGDVLTGDYHLIVSNMTLHHIKDVRPVLDQFYRITVPSGCLCIADLDPDDGKFHDSNDGVFQFGFRREALCEDFMASGFKDVRHVTAAEIIKPDSEGMKRRFSVFLMIGRK